MHRLTPRKTESIRSAYGALRWYGAINNPLGRIPAFSAKRLFWLTVIIVVLVFVFGVPGPTLLLIVAGVIGLIVLLLLGAQLHFTRALSHIENARFSCPRCDVFIPSRESWYCPGCKKTNPKSDNPYEFLNRCPNCRYEPTLYQCPHCPKEITLFHRPDPERVAYNPERAKLPPKQPPTLEEQLQQNLEEHRLREAHAHAKHGVTAEEKLEAFKRWRALEKKHLAHLAQQREASEISEEEYQDLCNQVIQFIAMNSTID